MLVFHRRVGAQHAEKGLSRYQDILRGKSFHSKLSGNEGYCTNASLVLIKIMMCSKFHCQKGFNSIAFSYDIGDSPDGAEDVPPPAA